MLASLESLITVALIALPGAAYTWGFEQAVGGWGVGLADRTLRFIGGSAVFAVLTAPLTYWFYTGQVASGRFGHGQFWWPSWPLAIAYVVVPFVVGRITGQAVQHGRRWPRLLVGPAPAPRAWDHLFLSGRSAWLRIRLKDPAAGTDGWVLGIFSPHQTLGAYASGPPHAPDLYLSDTAEAEPGTGEFRRGQAGLPFLRGAGLLIRYEEILYIEVIWKWPANSQHDQPETLIPAGIPAGPEIPPPGPRPQADCGGPADIPPPARTSVS